jgi:hypothetical protein
MKNLIEGSQCPGLDSNRASPEHKSRALPLRQPAHSHTLVRTVMTALKKKMAACHRGNNSCASLRRIAQCSATAVCVLQVLRVYGTKTLK